MTTSTIDSATLADLVTFARIEVESRDVEPWADLIEILYTEGALDREEAIWLLTLYNSHDDLGSAWTSFRRWETPAAWAIDPHRADAARYNCTQERRNLRGGRVLKRHASYVEHVVPGSQYAWLRAPLVRDDPGLDFARLTGHLRAVWGVGRQSAFEWAEFLAKVIDFPVDAADAQLWESSGPRRSLERIYGNPHPSRAWLDATAAECKAHLRAEGVDLSWFDFETIICDFNVMRDGRYYPGRHLAALTEEIEAIEDDGDRGLLRWAFETVVPAEWASIPPGINPDLLPVYRDTGRILMEAAP